jgi:hypothetical protein
MAILGSCGKRVRLRCDSLRLSRAAVQLLGIDGEWSLEEGASQVHLALLSDVGKSGVQFTGARLVALL